MPSSLLELAGETTSTSGPPRLRSASSLAALYEDDCRDRRATARLLSAHPAFQWPRATSQRRTAFAPDLPRARNDQHKPAFSSPRGRRFEEVRAVLRRDRTWFNSGCHKIPGSELERLGRNMLPTVCANSGCIDGIRKTAGIRRLFRRHGRLRIDGARRLDLDQEQHRLDADISSFLS